MESRAYEASLKWLGKTKKHSNGSKKWMGKCPFSVWDKQNCEWESAHQAPTPLS